jgi:hypothetical protein
MFFQRCTRCTEATHRKTAMAVRASIESDRPTSLLDSEVETSLTTHLPQSAEEPPDTSQPYRYKEVYVLMFLWKDDDLQVLNEVQQLRDVFSTLYNFKTHISIIPSRRPYQHVKNELSRLQHILNRTDCLVIVYYAGHGYLFKYGKMTWSAYE